MAADSDALNYPYIRVRSADWLKRTLLIFPHVLRMSPNVNAPADDPDIADFTHTMGGRGHPLLGRARLSESHVIDTQRRLITDLRSLIGHDEHTARRFAKGANADPDSGETATRLTVWERRLSPGATFQIHRDKLLYDLVQYLESSGLAWEPETALADGPQYLEMNPCLGEAVMATLAVACAENEGLQVVTEFPKLHGRLIGMKPDSILRAALGASDAKARKRSGQLIAEFLVYRRCNVQHLTAKKIAELSEERQALAAFRHRLEEIATALPDDIRSDRTLDERLHDLLDDAFAEWRRDELNLGSVRRKFFGEGVLEAPQKIIQKLVETALSPETIVTGAATGTVGAQMGGPSIGAISAVGGFAVAIVFRVAESWGKAIQTAETSPYRYLSLLEDQGVAFSFSR